MKKKLCLTYALLLTATTGVWADDAITVTPVSGKTNEWTFTMPAKNVEVEVTYYTQAEIDQEAADAVIAQINNLGTVTYTTACKEKIDAAKSAYNALTADQKALVSNYATLTAAETAYNNLKTQVEAAVAKIEQIGEVAYTDECKEKIDAARAAYDALTDEQKAAVDNYTTLTEAEAAYANMQTQVTAAEGKIEQIGEVAYTDECKQKIEAAEAAYAALTADQKVLVSNYSTLIEARILYDNLKTQVDAAVAKIDAIGEVKYTAESKAKIDAARAAYDALTDEQKAAVDNKVMLTEAETAYNNLKTQVEAAVAKIDAIDNPVVYTAECKQKIDAARAAYDALTDEQKAAINPATVERLTAAEARYTEMNTQVDNTVALIGELSDVTAIKYTDEWKQKIDAASQAYEALTDEQRAAIKMSVLVDLVAAIDIYNLLDSQVKAAIAAIDNLGTVEATDEFKQRLDAAHTAYDTLTDEQKAAVTNAAELADATAAYEALVPTAINNVNADADAGMAADGKYVKDGKLIIIKNGKQYNANGTRIK